MHSGCLSVKKLLKEVDSAELSELIAYAALEPFGPRADNLNFGILNSILVNTNRGKGKRAIKPMEMALGDFGEELKTQNVQEMLSVMKSLASSHNKKVRKKKRG